MHSIAGGSRVWRGVVVFVVTIAMVLAMTPVVASAQATIWVDDDATGTEDGSEENPYGTIEDAMAAADPGDHIMVMPGVYTPAGTIDYVEDVTVRSTDGYTATHIDLGGIGAGSVGLDMTDAGAATLEGFRVDGGVGPDAAVWIDDTAAADDGEVSIEDNYFVSNTLEYGAIVATNGVAPTIRLNIFASNTSSTEGGAAVHVAGDASPVVYLNRFDGNVSAAGVCGAAMYVQTDDVTIMDNVFVDNAAQGDGGAICIEDTASFTVEGCTFEDNVADNGGDGGAMDIEGSTGTIEGCEFYGNDALDDGGALYVYQSTVEVWDSWFRQNTSGPAAGAYGAAIFAGDSTVHVRHGTFYGNSGGYALRSQTQDAIHVRNSIIWDGGDGQDVYQADIAYSLTQDADLADDGNTTGAGLVSDAPLFYGAADFRLLVGSPAIDAGTTTAAFTDGDDIDGTARPQDGDGNGSDIPDLGAWERPDLEVTRWGGADRYETAALVAENEFDPDDTGVAIVATGEDFPDALVASGIAGVYDAPILLVRRSGIPQATLDALAHLDVSDVIIIGGTGVVDSSVESRLEDDYGEDHVVRLAGQNRYETAERVARAIAQVRGADFGKEAFLARGDLFPDALSVSPMAFALEQPILLTLPEALPTYTAAVTDDLDIEVGYAIGGTGAVADGVKTAWDSILDANGGSDSERWGGADRYATACVVADGAVADGLSTWDYVGIARGDLYPDALTGGAAAGNHDGVVMLTLTDELVPCTHDRLHSHGSHVVRARIFGGTGAVSAGVASNVMLSLGW